VALVLDGITIRSAESNVVSVNQTDTQEPMPGEPPSDNTLIQRVSQGDDQALALLYDRYSSIVLGIALKILHQRELADEVTQESFWRVWQRANTFDGARGNLLPGCSGSCAT
jgi:RNA polymerase sigma-70 factor (ECF subfamily)